MTWDSVPWFVGGGAQHSPEIARLLAYAATSGAEGIVTSGDLKVAQLAVAGSSVRVLAGACLIRNRAAGGDEQTYVGRNPDEDDIAISATGSGSGRNDLVIARVEDPFMAGESWQDPADVTVGPYIFTRVLPNVPDTAITSTQAAKDYIISQGFSAIPLAAVVIPANTATFDDSMIRDLRQLATPRESRVVDQKTPVQGATLTSTAYVDFPVASSQITVPSWATEVYATVTLSNIQVEGGDTWGNLRLVLGSLDGPAMNYDFNTSTVDPSSETIITTLAADVTGLQGQTVTAKLQGVRYDPAQFPQITGHLKTLDSTQQIFDLQFYERPV